MIFALHRCTNLSLSHPLRQAALSGARKTVVAQQNLGHLSVMMRYAVLSLQRLVLVAALTVALVATGFAHRLPSTDDASLAAYALAGGDIADIWMVMGSPITAIARPARLRAAPICPPPP
jgi:hypothetical protein